MYIVNIFKLQESYDTLSSAIWGGLNTLMQKMTRDEFQKEMKKYNISEEKIQESLNSTKNIISHQWTDKWTIYIQSYKL